MNWEANLQRATNSEFPELVVRMKPTSSSRLSPVHRRLVARKNRVPQHEKHESQKVRRQEIHENRLILQFVGFDTQSLSQDYRIRLFRIFLENAPGLFAKIPALSAEARKRQSIADELAHTCSMGALARGSGECPLGESQQTQSASSGKGIDADAGRAEADKEQTVKDIGKDVGLTFERRSVGGEPQYNEEY